MTIDQDRDVLAAEYVLGTLGPDERAEAQALIAIEPSFAEVVRGWERRLGELSAMVDPVEPPSDMWDRIKAGIAVSEKSARPPPAADTVTPATAPAPGDVSAETAAAAAAAPASAPAAATVAGPEPVAATAATSEAAVPEAATPEVVTPEAAAAAAVTEAAPPAAEPPVAPAAVPPAVPLPRSETGAEVIRLAGRVRRWRTATALTGALAACFLALVVTQHTNPDLLPVPLQPKPKMVEVVKTVEVPSPRPAEFVAVLQKDATSPAFLLTFDLEKRMLTVRTVGAERQAGKSYELWLVSDKFAAPRSLGVIGAVPYTVRPAEPDYDPVIINRATYAVSLEPEGGSPTGAPTGPVLYTGRLLQATAPDFPARTP